MKKLPDNIACRRLLIKQRKYHKDNIKTKGMSEQIFRVNGGLLTSVVKISHNSKTDTIVINNDFYYKGIPIFKRTKKRIKCNTETGKIFINNHRKYIAERVLEIYYKNKRK